MRTEYQYSDEYKECCHWVIIKVGSINSFLAILNGLSSRLLCEKRAHSGLCNRMTSSKMPTRRQKHWKFQKPRAEQTRLLCRGAETQTKSKDLYCPSLLFICSIGEFIEPTLRVLSIVYRGEDAAQIGQLVVALQHLLVFFFGLVGLGLHLLVHHIHHAVHRAGTRAVAQQR